MKKLFSLFLSVTVLCCTMAINGINAYANSVVYTGVNIGVQDGTRERPYNNLIDAIDNVSQGGVVYIVSGSYSFVNDLGDDMPLVIDKEITIATEPNANDRGAISTRSAGIVLGADVVFSNIDIGLASAYHNAICANGYSLTLDNVGRYTGHRIANIFAGGMASVDGTLYAPMGDHASVTISGENSEYDGVFAGGLNCGYDGDVNINITGNSSMKLGESYSCGAVEAYVDRNDWFNFESPATPIPYKNFAVNSVTWNINQGKSKLISGLGANVSTVNFYANINARESTVSFDNITNLNIISGVVEPVNIENIGNVGISNGATLDLQNTDEFSCYNYTSNGILVLAQDSFFTINGAVSGTTEFQTANGYNGMSGTVIDGHTYINAPNSNKDSFVFNANYGQEDYTLDFDNGLWIAHSNSTPSDNFVTSIAFGEDEMTFTDGEVNSYFCSIPIMIESTEDDDASYYDYTYTVVVNGEKYVSVPDEDYLGVAYIEELNLEFFMYSESAENCVTEAFIEVGPRENSIAAGDYLITISSGDISDTMRLIVNHNFVNGTCNYCGAEEEIALDFSAFDMVYQLAMGIDRAGYTAESLQNLDIVLVDKATLVTQKDIDFATANIQTALSNLVAIKCNVVFNIIVDYEVVDSQVFECNYGDNVILNANDFDDFSVYKWTVESDKTTLLQGNEHIKTEKIIGDSIFTVYLFS